MPSTDETIRGLNSVICCVFFCWNKMKNRKPLILQPEHRYICHIWNDEYICNKSPNTGYQWILICININAVSVQLFKWNGYTVNVANGKRIWNVKTSFAQRFWSLNDNNSNDCRLENVFTLSHVNALYKLWLHGYRVRRELLPILYAIFQSFHSHTFVGSATIGANATTVMKWKIMTTF